MSWRMPILAITQEAEMEDSNLRPDVYGGRVINSLFQQISWVWWHTPVITAN
jgi:hypothetical protein